MARRTQKLLIAVTVTCLVSVWFSVPGMTSVIRLITMTAGGANFEELIRVWVRSLTVYQWSLPFLAVSGVFYLWIYFSFSSRIRLIALHILGGLCGLVVLSISALPFYIQWESSWALVPFFSGSGFTAGFAGSVIFVRSYEGIWWRKKLSAYPGEPE